MAAASRKSGVIINIIVMAWHGGIASALSSMAAAKNGKAQKSSPLSGSGINGNSKAARNQNGGWRQP
jgi:hypothetical protein